MEIDFNAIREFENYKRFNKLDFYDPYPFQKCFHHAEGGETYHTGCFDTHGGLLARIRALQAGNQCITFDTLVDTEDGPMAMGEIFGHNIRVMAWDGEKKVPKRVLNWFRKPAENCYRITMSDGRWIECSAEHRILTNEGYVSCGSLLESCGVHPQSISGISRLAHGEDGQRWSRIASGYLDSCLMDSRQSGGRLLCGLGSGQVFFPSQDGVQLHTSCQTQHEDGLDNTGSGSLFSWLRRLSSLCDVRQIWGRFWSCVAQVAQQYVLRMIPSNQYALQSANFGYQGQTGLSHTECQQQSYSDVSHETPNVDGNQSIVSIRLVGSKNIYDMEVEDLHNYCAGGLVNHNSGKTLSAGTESAMHATGRYPDWWKGHRFNRPTKGTVCGVINDKTRDICQAELFGEPGDKSSLGTGMIPKDCIGEITRKPGVPNAFDSVFVKHYTDGAFDGWSKVFFGSYQQDINSLMGTRMDWIWGDEEPPQPVHSQFMRSTLSTRGIIFYSFTPEQGMTELVLEFQEDLKENMALVRATWDDAPHFNDPAYRKEAEEQFPFHEREMRRQGIPMMGTGLIWPVKEEDISCQPFDIPRHWPKICAVDFGMDHPFAAVWSAWDRDTDTVYIYDCYRASRKSEGRSLTIAEHASAIKRRGDWIPCVWPHDMNQEDPKSCKALHKLFHDEGVNMRPEHFTNPPEPGQKKGDMGVEVGIQHILDRMQTGTFKVFKHLDLWFGEFRSYHRDTGGKIVKIRDDLMAATRYNVQSVRFAYTEPVMKKTKLRIVGAKNW